MATTCTIDKQANSVYNSDWVAGWLPLRYDISNTKFPVNTTDEIDLISSVSDNGGFAQINLLNTYETYVEKEWIIISDASESRYNGVWQIKELVSSTELVIETSYVGSSSGKVQRYYQNYHIKARIYAGIPENHYYNADDPIALITTFKATPNSSNVATIDISNIIQSKFSEITNDYCGQLEDYGEAINDINKWTSFYIEYAESYDTVSSGELTTFTSAYTTQTFDFTNESFDTASGAGWNTSTSAFEMSINSNTDWDFSTAGLARIEDDGVKTQFLTYVLGQNIINGTDCAIRINTTLTEPGVAVDDADLYLYENGVQVQDLTAQIGNDYSFTYTPQSSGGSELGIVAYVETANTSVQFAFDVLDFEVSQTQYYYASNSVQQPQYQFGNNMGEYVLNDNNLVLPTKFLTMFEEPTYFLNEEFDISYIAPADLNINDITDQVGYKITEYDRNGSSIVTNSNVITWFDEGLYRIRLSDLNYQANTAYVLFEIGVYRDAVYERLTEQKKIFVNRDCANGDNPVYLAWLNPLGGFDYYMMQADKRNSIGVESRETIQRDIFNNWDTDFVQGNTQTDQIKVITREETTANSRFLKRQELEGLKWLVTSIKVYEYFDVPSDFDCLTQDNKRTVLMQTDNFKYFDDAERQAEVQVSYISTYETLVQGQ